MATKEHIWHLRRHLGAREPALVGIEVSVLGVENTTDFVDNGLDHDGEAHLQAEECARAKEVGKSLFVAANVETVLRYSSPLVRAQETERYMFAGMAEKFAAKDLGVDVARLAGNRLTRGEKRILADRGLKKKATRDSSEGLIETRYKDHLGREDDGRQLVAQAYCPEVNPDFKGYRYMVQKGFEKDQRSEHPLSVAERGLMDVLPRVLQYSLVLSATHQPNLEAMCALLTKGIGTNGNELFANAGGPFDLGGGLQLIVYSENGVIVGADLMRTMDADLKNKLGYTNGNGTALTTRLEVNLDVLSKYATTQRKPGPQVAFGD